MCKRIKIAILSLMLSVLLLIGETICASAEGVETIPFSIGQNLSGTVANKGVVYYQFSLSSKKTITLKTTLSERQFKWEIKDYNDKSYCSQSVAAFEYNSITGQYSSSYSATLEKGTYYMVVKHDPYINHEGPVTYSIQTSISEAGAVSGTSGIIKIGIRLKRGKSLQLTSFLSGMSGKTTWRSSKKSVVKVTSRGKVTARKKGTATITAKCNGKTAKIKIKVY